MKNRLKILRIVTSLDPKFGGSSRDILESSRQLYQSGFQVDIITCDKLKIKILKIYNQISKKLMKISNNALNCFKNNFDLSSTKNSLGKLLKKILKMQINE